MVENYIKLSDLLSTLQDEDKFAELEASLINQTITEYLRVTLIEVLQALLGD